MMILSYTLYEIGSRHIEKLQRFAFAGRQRKKNRAGLTSFKKQNVSQSSSLTFKNHAAKSMQNFAHFQETGLKISDCVCCLSMFCVDVPRIFNILRKTVASSSNFQMSTNETSQILFQTFPAI